MSHILSPVSGRRRQKPLGAPRINRLHPVAMGARFLCAFNGFGAPRDLVTGIAGQLNGSAAWSLNMPGGMAPAVDLPNSGYIQWPDCDYHDVTGDVTVVWAGVIDTAQDTTLIGKFQSGGGGGTNTPYALQRQTSGSARITFNRANGSAFRVWGGPASFQTGVFAVIAVSQVEAMQNAPTGLYFNGGIVPGSWTNLFSGTGSGAATAANAGIRMGLRPDNVQQMDGRVAFAGVWNRILAPWEHVKIVENLASFAEEPVYRVYSFPEPGEPPLSAVDSELELEWSVRAFTSAEAELGWSILNFASAEAELEWSITAFASAEAELGWSITAFAAATLEPGWSIQAFASAEVVPAWSISAFVSKEMELAWAIRNDVSAEAELGWAIQAFASDTLEIAYDIETAPGFVSATLEIGWSLQAYVDNDILLRWKLLGLDSEVLANAYILTLPDRRATPAVSSPRVALVYADTVADARAMAKAAYSGDPDALWDAASAQEVDADGDLSGWLFRIAVCSPSGPVIADKSVRPVANYAVSGASLVDSGSGYSVSDVLTVAGGQGTPATITVSTVDTGGEILTFTVSSVGDYAVPPTADGNEPTISDSGSGAAFDLTLRAGHSVDALGAAMAAALNGAEEISGASYNPSTNVLTVASAGDALGNSTVLAGLYPPLRATLSRSVTPVFVGNHGFEDPELDADTFAASAPHWTFDGALVAVFNLTSFPELAPEGIQIVGAVGAGTVHQVLSETFIAGAEYTLRVAISDNTTPGFMVQRYRVQLLSEDPAEPGSLADASLLAEDDNTLTPFAEGEIKYATVRYKATEADHGRRIVIGLRNYDLSVPGETSNVGFDDVSLHVRYPLSSRSAIPGFVSSVTHEGSSGSALSVTLAADDFVMPKILAVGRSA